MRSAISTPSAVISGVARAARVGVLAKGGDPPGSLGKLGAVAFGKTGTLTESKPRVTDVMPMSGVAERDLLTMAVAVEDLSDHPLAPAVVRDGRVRLGDASVPLAADLRSIVGRGLVARIATEPLFVGKAALFMEIEGPPLPAALHAMDKQLEETGRTTMVVCQGTKYFGVLGLMDTPRTSAVAARKQLRALGIADMIMIPGDNRRRRGRSRPDRPSPR
jgi:Cd2+/Zn2+-exporting ATPase